MTQRTSGRPGVDAGLESVWQVPDAHVASGRIPGYAAAIRIGGRVEVRVGGRTAVEPASAPMSGHPVPHRVPHQAIGGALALSLVEDGVLALDDAIARWLPEAASPASSSLPTLRSTARPGRSGRSPSGTS